MKILCKTKTSNIKQALEVLEVLQQKHIGMPRYDELYGDCYVRDIYGRRTKGAFAGGRQEPDGSIKFRVRTWNVGSGGYEERTYDSNEIEFIGKGWESNW